MVSEGSVTSGTKKKIVVTGGAGYLGSAIVPTLAKNHEVTVVDSFLYKQQHSDVVETIREDIQNIGRMKDILKGKDVLVHLAGIVGEQACNLDKDRALQVNFLASRELVSTCGAQNTLVIYPSSCSVYGFGDGLIDENSTLSPLSLYAVSKIAEESAVRAHCPNSLVLRLGTLYGYSHRMRFDLVVNRFIGQAVVDGEITVYGGKQYRPFIHILDVAEAISHALDKGIVGLMNLGGRNYTIDEVAHVVSRGTGCRIARYPEIQDRRNYKIDSSKFERALDFFPHRDISFAVKEISEAIQSGAINSYRDPVYSNEESLRLVKS